MNQYTHKLVSSNRPVFFLPNSYYHEGKWISMVPPGYQRVFVPYSESEMRQRKNNYRGHVQTVRKDSLKQLAA